MKNHRKSGIQNRVMESWSHGVMVLFALPAQRFTVPTRGPRRPGASTFMAMGKLGRIFSTPILQAAWDVAFKQVFTCIHLSNCQINCHQLSNQSLNSHSEILWSWGCKITPWAMRTCACATCCHEWNAAMASWLRTAGSCGRWALTLLPARSSGTKSLALYGTLEGSNLFWIRQGSLPFALWSYGNLDQQW